MEYANLYQGEVICTGTNRRNVVKRARDTLNKENPPGEPVWTIKEVEKMVGTI